MIYSICIECRKRITTDMEVCPHCGMKFTIDMFNTENICKCNGVDCDMSPIVNDILNEKAFDIDAIFDDMLELTKCANCITLYNQISRNRGKVPPEFNGPTNEEMRAKADAWSRNHPMPKCPTCGSTNIREIGFGERTLSVNLFGLSSNKFNKSFECNNCGYTW